MPNTEFLKIYNNQLKLSVLWTDPTYRNTM